MRLSKSKRLTKSKRLIKSRRLKKQSAKKTMRRKSRKHYKKTRRGGGMTEKCKKIEEIEKEIIYRTNLIKDFENDLKKDPENNPNSSTGLENNKITIANLEAELKVLKSECLTPRQLDIKSKRTSTNIEYETEV